MLLIDVWLFKHHLTRGEKNLNAAFLASQRCWWTPRGANHVAHLVGKWVASQGFVGPIEPLWLPPIVSDGVARDSIPLDAL